jgi:hypothetical protein
MTRKTDVIMAGLYYIIADTTDLYEGVSKSFRTGRLERELRMVTALCH